MIQTVSSIFSFISGKYESNPHWDHWPFGPGYGDFWASAAKMLFVAAILGVIVIFLRVLFGPTENSVITNSTVKQLKCVKKLWHNSKKILQPERFPR